MKMSWKSEVDPKSIRINIRYRDISRTPEPVKRACTQIAAEAEAAKKANGFNFSPDANFGVDLIYVFNDKKADVDGPGKRALDSIAAGLGFNDNRVLDFRQRKTWDDTVSPHILIEVWTLDHHDPVEVEPLEDAWRIRVGETSIEVANHE